MTPPYANETTRTSLLRAFSLLAAAGLLLLCPLRERVLLRLIPLCYGAALILPAGLLWCAAILPDMLSFDWRVLIAQLGCALAGIALSRHYARS